MSYLKNRFSDRRFKRLTKAKAIYFIDRLKEWVTNSDPTQDEPIGTKSIIDEMIDQRFI